MAHTAVRTDSREGARWLAGFGLLPIPGPFDEAVLLVVALILFVFYRRQLKHAWGEAGAD